MQEDQELAAIRAARLGQLQQNARGEVGDDEDQNKQKVAAAAQEEQMRRDLLATVLDGPARERREKLVSGFFAAYRCVLSCAHWAC
jgi:DNA-binding TFAR19-related protein (PDSD5 family)